MRLRRTSIWMTEPKTTAQSKLLLFSVHRIGEVGKKTDHPAAKRKATHPQAKPVHPLEGQPPGQEEAEELEPARGIPLEPLTEPWHYLTFRKVSHRINNAPSWAPHSKRHATSLEQIERHDSSVEPVVPATAIASSQSLVNHRTIDWPG